jgi:hypothetical protein
MRVKIENFGPAPIIVRDALGDLRRLEAGEDGLFIGPTQGRLIDGNQSSYRCTPAE